MNEQSIVALIAMALAAINVWGVFILSGISRKFEGISNKLEAFADKLDKFMPREEANDRFREHSEADGKMFEREQRARHDLADRTGAQLLDHERRLTVAE